MQRIARFTIIPALLVAVLALFLAACQPITTFRGLVGAAGTLRLVDSPETTEFFKLDQVTLDPTTAVPEVEGSQAAAELAKNPFVSFLLAKGYDGTVQFGSYTSRSKGTVALDPDGNPVPGAPLDLTFDRQALWTVLFTHIKADDYLTFVSHGPPGAAPSTADEDLLLAFSSDAKKMLNGDLYPSSGPPAEVTRPQSSTSTSTTTTTATTTTTPTSQEPHGTLPPAEPAAAQSGPARFTG